MEFEQPEVSRGEVTKILNKLKGGRKDSFPLLISLVYEELRRLASDFMRREPANHTLQTTALVHEAYFRLVDQRRVKWENRAHFFAVAAQAMRRILVDHARAHQTAKRGGEMDRIPLEEELLPVSLPRPAMLLALDEALTRLATMSPRQAQIVELLFFAGMTVEETAQVLRVSPRTVNRDWAVARAWLHCEIGGTST
jgi:RNA polymerase sigma-70 factor, ECF subfamily